MTTQDKLDKALNQVQTQEQRAAWLKMQQPMFPEVEPDHHSEQLKAERKRRAAARRAAKIQTDLSGSEA